jgi:hypothetical protein
MSCPSFSLPSQQSCIGPDQGKPVLHARAAPPSVLGGVKAVIEHAAHVGFSHVKPRIRTGVIDEKTAVLPRDRSMPRNLSARCRIFRRSSRPRARSGACRRRSRRAPRFRAGRSARDRSGNRPPGAHFAPRENSVVGQDRAVAAGQQPFLSSLKGAPQRRGAHHAGSFFARAARVMISMQALAL